MKAVWTSSLESGNATIDEQHKELFEHINNFFDSISREFSHEITVRTLNYLVKYVRFHFSTEEELMRKSGYPDLKEHMSAHRNIVNTLMACYKKLISSGNSERVEDELTTLLQVWFVEHIMGYDLRLAAYLRSNAE
ncbi:hemerythrin-like metal-binding protein [Denitrovibrio acetiphilus DSM 12809]|uniref:Hemerythrin-like metal-binding protein n=1 Tax=Denitrovibrio acetiphilus (strain DSM 12809 / NBRC 114555 / N2460) TaxID=522772 RepID=D4H367_DENA2|nr:bacteriohemerythrin [Denitrovibrio acetiphilus]ADD67151.1 hemerythrin-like metal-binding protein [Denitrovibrio acetiphilus DSM 12809]